MSEGLTNDPGRDDAPSWGIVPDAEVVTELEVRLVVPARPEMWSIVRVTASALAARVDFTLEDIEDLRLAVTELCGSCATGADPAAQCECRFSLHDHQLEVFCRVAPVGPDEAVDEEFRLMSTLELSRQILQATVDHFDIEPAMNGAREGHLCKSRGPSDISRA